jgi:hypothetical protein
LRTRRRALLALAAAAIAVASAASAAKVIHAAPRSASTSSALVADIAATKLATAKYVNNLALARKDGYQIITKMIPTMGYHYMNPAVKGFDVSRPPILVYEHSTTGVGGSSWQLGAVEWVFTSKPATPPVPGATYGTFGAGCHFADGTFVPAAAQASCPPKAPGSGAKFTFWHPQLVTLHMWLWYPNPSGLFSGTNPLVTPFNHG